MSDEITAFHEAGHAVVGYVVGGTITHASIVSGAGHSGKVRIDHPGVSRVEECGRDARIALGALAAEMKRKGGTYEGIGATMDKFMARELLVEAATLQGDDPDAVLRTSIQNAMDEATAIIEEHWNAVEALAAELLQRKSLTGEEAEEVLDRLIGRSQPFA
jgi:ATP-dependent Zn protease